MPRTTRGDDGGGDRWNAAVDFEAELRRQRRAALDSRPDVGDHPPNPNPDPPGPALPAPDPPAPEIDDTEVASQRDLGNPHDLDSDDDADATARADAAARAEAEATARAEAAATARAEAAATARAEAAAMRERAAALQRAALAVAPRPVPILANSNASRGKGGKGLGYNAKRHRKVLRDNIQGVTKPAIRRLARRGGVKRISGLVYEETRGVYAPQGSNMRSPGFAPRS